MSKIRAVIYARYSSSSQKDASIEQQIRECQEYADRNDIQIVNVYSDHALTGRTDARPAFQRMIKDASRKQFEAILCWKLDRFARSREDSALYKPRRKSPLRRTAYVPSCTMNAIPASTYMTIFGLRAACRHHQSGAMG